jgi:hypothetical protein
MDFVARAGAIIDRAHRIAGVLLICVIVLSVVSTCQLMENSRLNKEADKRRVAYPVIVVPDATRGVYSPTEEDRLIQLFADFVTQSLLSFTPANVNKLYGDVRPFMGPALLTDSELYFQRKIRDAGADRRSSFFVPDRSQQMGVVKRSVNGQEFRDVTVVGILNQIVGGTVAESVQMEISMTFQKAFSSPSNPYGFILTAYHEKPLVNINKTPTLPGTINVQSGAN